MITVFKDPEDAGLICLGTPLCSQIQYSHIFVSWVFTWFIASRFSLNHSRRPWSKWSKHSKSIDVWSSKVLLKSFQDCKMFMKKPIRSLHWPIRRGHYMPENGPKWPNKYLKWRAEPIVTISCYWARPGSVPLSPPLASIWGQESCLWDFDWTSYF